MNKILNQDQCTLVCFLSREPTIESVKSFNWSYIAFGPNSHGRDLGAFRFFYRVDFRLVRIQLDTWGKVALHQTENAQNGKVHKYIVPSFMSCWTWSLNMHIEILQYTAKLKRKNDNGYPTDTLRNKNVITSQCHFDLIMSKWRFDITTLLLHHAIGR